MQAQVRFIQICGFVSIQGTNRNLNLLDGVKREQKWLSLNRLLNECEPAEIWLLQIRL